MTKKIKLRIKIFIALILAMANTSTVVADSADSTLDYVTYEELLYSLEALAKNTLEPSEVLKHEFLQLQKTHGISNSDEVYRDFVRVRLAFEVTRDSGLWQIVWAVTDREPNSDSIWSQWSSVLNPSHQLAEYAAPTAVAECDELSALFAFISRALGVEKVGLFWPTGNHTVAVWTAEGVQGEAIRIVVPTSQIYLSAEATLGTNEFDPYQQKKVYDYDRKDISKDHRLPRPLAEMMIRRVEEYGAKPASYLQERRNNLSRKLGGS